MAGEPEFIPPQFYYDVDGLPRGPVNAKQLKQLAIDGVVQPTTKVWKDGSQQSFPASKIKGLRFKLVETQVNLVEKPEFDTPKPKPTINRSLTLGIAGAALAVVCVVCAVLLSGQSTPHKPQPALRDTNSTQLNSVATPEVSPSATEKASRESTVVAEKKTDVRPFVCEIHFQDIGRVPVGSWPSAVVCAGDNTVVCGQLDITPVRAKAPLVGVPVGDPTFVKNNGLVESWNITTHTKKLNKSHPLPGGVRALAIDPSGKRLAIAGLFSHIAVTDDVIQLDRWKEWRFGNEAYASDVAFSNDGKQLFATTTDGRLLVFDTAEGTKVEEIRIRKNVEYSDVNKLSISPDSTCVLYWHQSEKSAGNFVVNLSSRPAIVHEINGALGPAVFLTSNDDILFANNIWHVVSHNLQHRSELYRLTLGREESRTKIASFPAHIDCIVLQPTCTTALIGDSKGAIHSVDWKNGTKLETQHSHTHSVSSISFSRDCRRIASLGFGNYYFQLTSVDGQSTAVPPKITAADVAVLAAGASDPCNPRQQINDLEFKKSWGRLMIDPNPDVSYCQNAVRELWAHCEAAKIGELELLGKQIKMAADAAAEIAKEKDNNGDVGLLVKDHFAVVMGRLNDGQTRREIAELRLIIWNRLIDLISRFSGKVELEKPPVEVLFEPTTHFNQNAGLPDDLTSRKWLDRGPVLVRLRNVSGRSLKNCVVALSLCCKFDDYGREEVIYARTHLFVADWAEGTDLDVSGKGTIGDHGEMFYFVKTAKIDVYELQGRHLGESIAVDAIEKTRNLIRAGDVFKGNWEFGLKKGPAGDQVQSGSIGLYVHSVTEPSKNKSTTTAKVSGVLFDPKVPKNVKEFSGQYDRFTGQFDIKTSVNSGPAVPGSPKPSTINLLRKGDERSSRLIATDAGLNGGDSNGIAFKLSRDSVPAAEIKRFEREMTNK